MIAALQMYDWPELRDRTDAFWEAVRGALARSVPDAPLRLSRNGDEAAAWADPDLLLGQTCGLPFVSGRCGLAEVFACPDYGLPGASSGLYASAIVVRRGARPVRERAAVAAINGMGSQSGCHALADWALTREGPVAGALFGGCVVSGAHRASAAMVARGEADIAALDAVAWALVRRHDPDVAAALDVLEWTRPMPALPFVTAPAHAGLIGDLRAALAVAAAGVDEPGLPIAILSANAGTYRPIALMAAGLGGMRLAPGTAPLGAGSAA